MAKKSSNSSASSNTAQQNGSIGGNITKKNVERAKETTDIEQLKQEVAEELGITPGKNSTAEECGRLGGEMTRRLYSKGEQANSSSSKSKSNSNSSSSSN